jgi:hypothetical protein
MRGVGGGRELGAMVCVRGGRDGDRVFEEERRKRVDWGKEGVEIGSYFWAGEEACGFWIWWVCLRVLEGVGCSGVP